MSDDNNGFLRIFWPVDVYSGDGAAGVMVGWKNSETDVVVVTIIDSANVRRV